VGLTLNYKRPI